MLPFKSRRAALLPLAAVAPIIAACGKEEKPPPPPPPQVGYIVMQPQPVTLTTNLPGRTTAYRVAEVRPQVSGVVQKRMFTEGANVRAGQQLYQIDPATYQAALQSALAAQAKAEANVQSTRALEQRYKPLVDEQAVSKQDYDNAVASRRSAEADVATAKANVDTARINLVYTKVLAPISGRTGRSAVTEGALVTANQAEPLASIQQLDPIYVDVVQPSTQLLKLRRDLASGKLKASGPQQAIVKLQLEDGAAYPQPGLLKFSEVTVDQGTGAVTVRAQLPNPDGTLLPGMFVHLQLEEGRRDSAILVPQQGISRNPNGSSSALVVGPDDTAQSKPVKLDRALGAEWLVAEGLVAGDRVIVQGLQQAKPNAKVTPKETTRAELAKPPPPAPSAPAAGNDKEKKKEK